jgi:Tol biopolymer transport system component
MTVSPDPTAPPSVIPSASASAAPQPTRIEHIGYLPVDIGEPIDPASLSGTIVFDDFENVYAMNIDGTDLVTVADAPGSEFDGAWSPDGQHIVYRDSTRGINENDEIFVATSDGAATSNITNDPANDWGPDWSHDGSTIVFNSDRDGFPLQGYLMDPDGSNVRRIGGNAWLEYPQFSPDDTKIVYMGAAGSDYSIHVLHLVTGVSTQLTDTPGNEGWPAWSPDGSTIAFSSQQDDCRYVPGDQECWTTGEEDEHRDIWLVDADGANLRRVTPEYGQFMTWSPDGQFLLISGRGLYVVRLDGTGRLAINPPGVSGGGIPDWR